jgi:hypothetical protein
MGKLIPVRVKLTAVNDYMRNPGSLKEVAERHGVSHETLRKWLGDSVRKRGRISTQKEKKSSPAVEARKALGFPSQNKRWSKLEDESLIEAVRSGMTVEETSNLIGRTPHSIYTRKHHLSVLGKLEERFTVPEGIKRHRKPKGAPVVSEAVVMASMEEQVKDVPINEVPEVDMEAIRTLSLETLVSLVSQHGVILNIDINGDTTSVMIRKG